MSNELQLEHAVIYSSRSDILDALKQEVRAAGFAQENIKLPNNIDECMAELDKLPFALIVIDWEVGVDEALKILSSNLKKHKIDARPVFLIAAKVDERIVAAGAEFGVAQINVGEISRDRIKASIRLIMEDLQKVRPIRDALLEVAELRSNDDWAAATKKLEELHKNGDGNLRVTAELAENYMQAGDWAQALVLLENFPTVAAAYPRGLHLLGRCLMKLGKNEEAAAVLQQAKIINPYNVDRLVDLGDVLLGLDRVEEAQENFDEALKFAPGSDAAKKGVSKVKLMEGDVNEALAILNEITSGHELASVFNTAAVISIRNKRYQEGMRLYEAALKAVDNQKLVMSRLYFNMGIGFHRWTKPDDALRCFKQALALDPNYENAKHNVTVMSGSAEAETAPAPTSDEDVTIAAEAAPEAVVESTDAGADPGPSPADEAADSIAPHTSLEPTIPVRDDGEETQEVISFESTIEADGSESSTEVLDFNEGLEDKDKKGAA